MKRAIEIAIVGIVLIGSLLAGSVIGNITVPPDRAIPQTQVVHAEKWNCRPLNEIELLCRRVDR